MASNKSSAAGLNYELNETERAIVDETVAFMRDSGVPANTLWFTENCWPRKRGRDNAARQILEILRGSDLGSAAASARGLELERGSLRMWLSSPAEAEPAALVKPTKSATDTLPVQIGLDSLLADVIAVTSTSTKWWSPSEIWPSKNPDAVAAQREWLVFRGSPEYGSHLTQCGLQHDPDSDLVRRSLAMSGAERDSQALDPSDPSQIIHIPLGDLSPSPWNPRNFTTPDASNAQLKSLATSIKEIGVLQPIVVRPLAGDGGKFQIVAGERRFRAARLAGLATIPAVVRELTDQEAVSITVCENLQREGLSVLEEASGVASLIETGWTPEAVADKLGKPAAWVARRARLSRLSDKWRAALLDPDEVFTAWPATNLEVVTRLDTASQDAFLEQCQNRLNYDTTEKELRRLCYDFMRRLDKAPWDLEDATLLPVAGSCTACPRRSDRQALLFEEDEQAVKDHAHCLDSQCWQQKQKRHVVRVAEAWKPDGTAAPQILEVRPAYQSTATWGRVPDGLQNARGVEMERCKKTDEGAAPAVTPEGDKTWVRPIRKGAKAPGGEAKKESAAPKPLAERRAQLNRRRVMRACELAAEACLESKYIPTLREVVTAAAIFGTADRESPPFPVQDEPEVGEITERIQQVRRAIRLTKEQSKRGDAYENAPTIKEVWTLLAGGGDPSGELTGRAMLWVRVRDVWVEFLRCRWTPDDLAVAACEHYARLLVEIARTEETFEAMFAVAVAEIPTPKSWAAPASVAMELVLATQRGGKAAAAGDAIEEPAGVSMEKEATNRSSKKTKPRKGSKQ